ncbi:Ankyrin-3 (ANK-3) (Ankyrin-G) [Durusdinium trenchii]|uniref:Ankyrin-3 (ANK-3) (Ankyrin-G) n=1 Tax=Durusdinium trenchii TaxID=1381693 RepID=A0ABP0REZ2_9DINO
MVTICSLAGECLATFGADVIENVPVKWLKEHSSEQVGASRFRQQWLTEDGRELNDEAVLSVAHVQLVVLNFLPCEQHGNRLIAATGIDSTELEELLCQSLQERRSPVAKDRHGKTALLIALKQGHRNCAALLLKAIAKEFRGIKLDDVVTQFGETALHLACHEGYLDLVQILLHVGADPVAKDSDGNTALLVALKRGHQKCVTLLLKAAAKENWGIKPDDALHLACQNGYSDMVQTLLDVGADLGAKDSDGNTALLVALKRGHGNCVILLLRAIASEFWGIKPDDVVTQFGETALHLACQKGYLDLVQTLLDVGADPGRSTICGDSPLHLAALEGHAEVVKLLLEAGAQKDSLTSNGGTALHLAAWKGHRGVVDLLLKTGIDVNKAKNGGDTALHMAAWSGHLEVVRLLLECGANTDQVEGGGKTAAQLAALHGHAKVLRLLDQAKPDLEQPTKRRREQ